MFTYAVRVGVVSENPCSKVTVPKIEQKEKQIYTPDELEKLLSLLKDVPLKYTVFFNLLTYSGFRRGEMLGLEWKDVDFENNLIGVRRTSNYTARKGMYTDKTKTKRSQHILKFPQEIMNLLKVYRDEQDKEREKLGSKWVETDRLFTKWNGEPMHNNTPYNWLKRFCEAHNFRFCDIHSLRHFYASALISKDIDPATVSAALGHSTITTTLTIYSHAFQQAQAKASNAIADVLNF